MATPKGTEGVPEVSVAPALNCELGEVVTIARAAIAGLSHQRGGRLLAASVRQPDTDELAAAIATGNVGAFLGRYDKAPVGAAVVRATATGAGRLARVELLYVEPGAREVGVGEALVAAVATWAVVAGCTGLDVDALPGDRATKSFLEATGFRARLIVMHHELAPGRDRT